MSEAEAVPVSDVPLFDVVVSVPSGTRLEDVERLAGDAGIAPERVAALISALRSVPKAKIGAAVSRERADKAKQQFSKAGLEVHVTPVLSLGAMVTGSFDGKHHCPACNTRVVLPENRQCPNCGVYVDKITEEELLRRKIMEQERNKLEFQATRDAKENEKRIRDALEAAVRAQVRAELEAEYGLSGKKGLFGSKAGIAKLAGVLGLAAVAFIGGRAASMGGTGGDWKSLLSMGPSKTAEAPGTKGADVDKMLDSVGPKGGGAGGAGGGAVAAATTGDADLDDPLIQAATKGKKMDGKGLTIEQAVAASQKLAASVGNTTAQRALAGGGPGGPGGPAGAAQGGAGPQGAMPDGSTPGGQDGAPTTAAVPAQTKLLLSADFARLLSEMGQLPRASGVITAVKASPALQGDAATAAAVQIAEIEIKAWAMRSLPEGRARPAAEALLAQAKALPGASERVQALGRAGAVVARHAQLQPEVARAFLTEAAEALKTIADPQQRNTAASGWAVSLGQVLMAQASASAKSGSWSKARAAGGQLEELVKQAPDQDALMRLHAIDYQVKQQLGLPDKAAQSLEAALALAGKTASLPERAAQLRVIAQLSEAAAGERMQAILAALQSQATAKGGMERAQTLASLSLLHAEAGMRGKAAELGDLARSTAGLGGADAVTVNTDLIVRSELAAARLLHAVGLYAESEAVLQRVGGYLL
jgi:hypothetical protein